MSTTVAVEFLKGNVALICRVIKEPLEPFFKHLVSHQIIQQIQLYNHSRHSWPLISAQTCAAVFFLGLQLLTRQNVSQNAVEHFDSPADYNVLISTLLAPPPQSLRED